MTDRKFTISGPLSLGLAALWFVACGGTTEDGVGVTPPATGGTPGGAGGTGGVTGGTGGTAGSSGGTGGAVAGQGGAGGVGGTTGGAGGTGGVTGGTGGVTGGTGGATAGMGGATAGMGGATAGMGGATAGMGGATAGMGGATAGMGGANSGTGGIAGSASGTGGTSGTAGTTSVGDDDPNSGEGTMGWIGCSMANNVAEGYARIGGTRMWGGYGNGGAVVQNWTNTNSGNWQGFDQQVANRGGQTPVAVWMMVCVFSSGTTMQEIRQMVANTKAHAPGAYLYISGQPLYEAGHVCTLAGDGMPEITDMQAQMMAAEDPDVHYVGPLGPLNAGEYSSDSCHTTSSGGDKIGRQVKAIWGQP